MTRNECRTQVQYKNGSRILWLELFSSCTLLLGISNNKKENLVCAFEPFFALP